MKELKIFSDEYHANERAEEEWRKSVKPGEKALRFLFNEYTEVFVKRVTKTKIVIGFPNNASAEQDFRKKDGRTFDRWGTSPKLLSPSSYNYFLWKEANTQKERRNLADAMNKRFNFLDYDYETLRAVEDILVKADQKKALDNSEKVD